MMKNTVKPHRNGTKVNYKGQLYKTVSRKNNKELDPPFHYTLSHLCPGPEPDIHQIPHSKIVRFDAVKVNTYKTTW